MMPYKTLLSGAWALLIKLLPMLIAAALCVAVYKLGYNTRDTEARAEVAALELKQSRAALAAEQDYTTKLQEAVAAQQDWLTRADEISRNQSATEQTIRAAARDLKKGIDDAVQKDAAAGCVPGLGPHGLHLYNRALGY